MRGRDQRRTKVSADAAVVVASLAARLRLEPKDQVRTKGRIQTQAPASYFDHSGRDDILSGGVKLVP